MGLQPTTRKVEVVESSDQREVILSTFDKSDHHPLAVSLVGTLWEGGRVALSTSFKIKLVHRKENTDSLTSRWSR